MTFEEMLDNLFVKCLPMTPDMGDDTPVDWYLKIDDETGKVNMYDKKDKNVCVKDRKFNFADLGLDWKIFDEKAKKKYKFVLKDGSKKDGSQIYFDYTFELFDEAEEEGIITPLLAQKIREIIKYESSPMKALAEMLFWRPFEIYVYSKNFDMYLLRMDYGDLEYFYDISRNQKDPYQWLADKIADKFKYNEEE